MKINGLDVVTLDFETFYGTGYSLTSMSTTDYIHDHKFKVHMVGIKKGPGKTQVYHDQLRISVALANIDWSKTALLCHNTQFDGYILYYHYRIHPAMYLDTLAMARGVHSHHVKFGLNDIALLHGREGKKEKESLVSSKNMRELTDDVRRRMTIYCTQDVDLTFEIFKDLNEVLPPTELKVIDIFIRMACWPILKVNVPRLLQHKRNVEDKHEEAINSCGATKDELVSNDKFAAKLREQGCEPPTKTSPRTGLETYAFSKADLNFQALARHPTPEVRKLYEARRICKSSIEQTRVQRFLDVTHNGRLPMPVFLSYAAAHTLRSTGCLIGGTKVTVKNPNGKTSNKRMTQVTENDLVWDGEEFVKHDGVVFSGFKKVINYGGIVGTPGHIVFTEEHGEIPLSQARGKQARLKCENTYHSKHKAFCLPVRYSQSDGKIPVFDILNCGPRHRFVANGKLVHNSNKMNLQNLTRGGELRRSIYVDPEERIVVADYSQVEARLTAWMAGLTEQLKEFARKKGDVYRVMATKIYGVRFEDVTKEQRFIAKCAVLGLGFQMGPTRFQNVLETGALGPAVFMPLDMCEKIVHGYRAANPGLAFIWNLMGHILFCMKEGIEGSYKCISWGQSHILLPNGQRLHYPGLRGITNTKEPWGQRKFSPTLEEATYHGKHGPQKIFPGYLLENIIQALARLVVTDAMVRIDDQKIMDIASMTHDEIIGVTSRAEAPRVYNQIAQEMTKPLSWAPDLPLAVEGGFARNYSK